MFSSVLSTKTADGIVDISANIDLSDPNRPMKIAEKLSEIFDYEWPKSIEALADFGLEEKECVNILLHFLTVSSFILSNPRKLKFEFFFINASIFSNYSL